LLTFCIIYQSLKRPETQNLIAISSISILSLTRDGACCIGYLSARPKFDENPPDCQVKLKNDKPVLIAMLMNVRNQDMGIVWFQPFIGMKDKEINHRSFWFKFYFFQHKIILKPNNYFEKLNVNN